MNMILFQIYDMYPAKRGDKSVVVLDIQDNRFGTFSPFCRVEFFTLYEVRQY